MLSEILSAILLELNTLSPDIEASAIISVDGLMMAAALPERLDKDQVAAMSTAMLALGDRTVSELGRGTLQQVLVKGINGYVVMTHAGKQAVLTVMVNNNARLGFIFLGIKKAAGKIKSSGIAKPNPRMGLVSLGEK